MRNEGALDFRSSESMTAHTDYIVDAAHYPQITLLITPCAIAGKVNPLDLRPVLLPVPFIVAPDRSQHRGPRPLNHEVAAFVCPNRLTIAGHYVGVDAWKR